jgi:nucleotide-binding universal stress UspA family protein
MFNKIVWATDGSQAADAALPFVKELAAEHSAPVVVCHSDVAITGPGAHGAPALMAGEDEIEAKLARQADELGADGVAATLRIVYDDSLRGGAARDIARVADEEKADVIVVGTRGHTALGGLLLGSVTQRLLHIANCPVLVIPARTRATTDAKDAEAEQTVA